MKYFLVLLCFYSMVSPAEEVCISDEDYKNIVEAKERELRFF